MGVKIKNEKNNLRKLFIVFDFITKQTSYNDISK